MNSERGIYERSVEGVIGELIGSGEIKKSLWDKATIYAAELADHMEERNSARHQLELLDRVSLRDIVYLDMILGNHNKKEGELNAS